MLISVVVPSFNSATTLRACLESLLNQTLQDFELIVVDGGSSDGTVGLIREFSSRIAAWTSEPDRGVYDAANKGVRRARGEWIYFLGADDRLSSDDTFGRMAPHLRGAFPAFRVVYGKVAMLGKGNEVLAEIGAPWPDTRKRLRSYMSLPHQGLFQHRSLFEESEGFDLSYPTGADYEFLLRELKERDALFVADVTVAACRTGGRSSRARDHVGLLREWRRAQRQHGFRMPSARWLVALVGARVHEVLFFLLGRKIGARVFDFVRAVFGKPPYWSRLP